MPQLKNPEEYKEALAAISRLMIQPVGYPSQNRDIATVFMFLVKEAGADK